MKKTTKKTFTRLTAAQKRVAIAKDAIKQLVAGRFLASRGTYISDNGMYYTDHNRHISQDTVGKRTFKPCRVCQIGQAIVSGIRLFNRLEIDTNTVSGSDLHREMRRWFTRRQTNLLETAFERRSLGRRIGIWDTGCFDAVNFGGNKCRTPRALSIAIWKNVIRNKGTFIP